MPERLAPNVSIQVTNLTGSVTDIDEDPDTLDGNWYTAVDSSALILLRTGFPTPSDNLVATADAQEFKIWVRNTGGNATLEVFLYENGVNRALLSSDTIVTSGTGQLFSYTWTASALVDMTGVDVELRLVGYTSPETYTVEVGAVEWNATVATTYPHSVSDGVEGGDAVLGAYEFALDGEGVDAGDAVNIFFRRFMSDEAVAGDTVADNAIIYNPGEVVITFN